MNIRFSRFSAFLSAAFALLPTAPATAQEGKPDANPAPPPGVSSQLQGLLGGVLKPSKSTAPPASTKFVSTGRPLFVEELLSKMTLEADPKEQFRKYAASVMQLVETAYKENGYETNDLGVALGGLLDVCYEMDQGTFKLGAADKAEEAADKKRTKAAVRQMQRALGAAPAFKSVSDKSKQLAYEACTFTMGHLAVSWQQAGKDEEKRKAVRQLARQQLAGLFRFDPDGITRNAAGEFVPKKKAEAANETPGNGAAVETPGSDAAPLEVRPDPPAETQPETAPPAESSANQPAPITPPSANSPASGGWKTARLAGGVLLMTPQNLANGETFNVAIFPLQSLSGKPIEAWLTEAVASDPFKPGKPAAPAIKAASANIASGTVGYALSGGASLLGVYTAISMDRETARLIRVLTPPDGKALTRYQEDVKKITNALIQADRKAAVTAGRGVDVEKVPDSPPGMSPGGKLQPGIYAGTQLYGDEANGRYRLYLYPNGQYRMFNAEGKQINSDVRLGYAYDHRTGKLDLESGMQFDMRNDRFDPNEDLCLYGQDATGKPYVYARSNRGFKYATTTLRYAGPLDKPSPKDEEEKKAWAEAEAKRYKWVVPPGQGLKPSEIAGIVHNQTLNQFYNGSGLSVSSTHDLYLLLTDGTVYNGLPVAPDELDVARSRRQEPEKWGRWKRSGSAFVAAWPDAPNQFKTLKGALTKPGAKGTKLVGRFGTGATSGSLLGGSYRLWGVTFTPEGRFRKDNRGGYGSSLSAQNSGMASINSTYDDEGSATSATGENFVVATSKKNKPGADRSGIYSVDGYTLTLRYDDGRVTRLPFFFEDAKRDALWFEGALLAADTDAPKSGSSAR